MINADNRTKNKEQRAKNKPARHARTNARQAGSKDSLKSINPDYTL
jgi:hypothetical protein